MNPFTVAMAAGNTAVQVLEMMTKQDPKTRKRVEAALQAGYTPEQVADFMSKEFQGAANTSRKGKIAGEIRGKPTANQKSEAQRLRGKREDRLGKLIGAAALGAAAQPLIGAALAGKGAQKALGRIGYSPQGPNNPPGSMPLPGAGPKGPIPGQPPMNPMGGGQGPGLPTQILQAYTQHLAKGGKMNLQSFMKTAIGTVAQNAMQSPAPVPPQQQAPVDATQEAQWSNPSSQASQMPQPGAMGQANVTDSMAAQSQPSQMLCESSNSRHRLIRGKFKPSLNR